MLEHKPHGKSIDWYGVGALLYELLVSVPPYFNTDEDKLYENILNAPLRIPQNLFSSDAESIIKLLLKRDAQERLGAVGGFEEIKRHAWFKDTDW